LANCALHDERPVVVQVLEGEDAVQRNRDIMGATNPADAADGTIRKVHRGIDRRKHRPRFGQRRKRRDRNRLSSSSPKKSSAKQQCRCPSEGWGPSRLPVKPTDEIGTSLRWCSELKLNGPSAQSGGPFCCTRRCTHYVFGKEEI
jgi:hypothetical protein